MYGCAGVRVGIGVVQQFDGVPLLHEVTEHLVDPVAALGWRLVPTKDPREHSPEALGLLDANAPAHQPVGGEDLLCGQPGSLRDIDRDPEQVRDGWFANVAREVADLEVDRGLAAGINDNAQLGRVNLRVMREHDQEDVRVALKPDERAGKVVPIEGNLVAPILVSVAVPEQLIPEEILIIGSNFQTSDRASQFLINDCACDVIVSHLISPPTTRVRGGMV